jgi:hypothetical protein
VRRVIEQQIDTATGVRRTEIQAGYRRPHRFGNAALTGIVRLGICESVTDMLSGCRAFSRRFVKTFPAIATGFETEPG